MEALVVGAGVMVMIGICKYDSAVDLACSRCMTLLALHCM
eukprot:SAG31_NODE_2719_length_5189_cov_4.394029_5_plen_40_part_00